jgi:DNA-binding response OmpR family regulator
VHSAASADGKPTASNGVDSEAMSPKINILVVDDQIAVVTMMRFLLTRAGCETQGALDAEKALRLAQAEAFDLITLDLEMPSLNGFQLFKRLKEIPHLAETPIVFVAGNASIENQQRGLDLGAADFIEKPFDTQDFIFRILSLVKETATA